MTEEKTKRGRGRPRKHFATTLDLAAVEAEVLPQRQTATEQLAALAGWSPSSGADVELAGGLLRDVRERVDALEAQRLTVAEPLTAAKKALDALYKPVKDVLGSMDAMLADKLLTYLTDAKQAQDEALQAVEAGARNPEIIALAHAAPVVPTGFTIIATVEVEVEDIAQVPRELLVLDMKAAKERVKAGEQIPGCRLVQKLSLRRVGGAA